MNDSTIKAHIIKEVCEYFNTTMYDLKQKSRERRYVEPRQFIYYYLRKYTNITLHEIAMIFYQDHSSVSHSINLIGDLIQYNGYSVKDREISRKIKNIILTGTGAKRRSYHYKSMRRKAGMIRTIYKLYK